MGAHAQHRMHDHSRAAFAAEGPKLSKRESLIYERIRAYGPHTDRELAHALGFGENLNAVRPRVTNLIESHQLMELAAVKCAVTGKTVRRVDIRRSRGQVELIA